MDGFLGPLGAFFRCAAEGVPGKAGGFAGERRSKEAGRGRPAEARGKADFATTPSGGHTFCSHRKYGERCAKGGTLWNPHKSGVPASVVFYTKGPLPETVKNPTGFFGPLFVRRTSCPISRRLPRSDIGGTAYSVRRREQSEPDGGGDALPKERTTERGSRPLWVYKGPCPLLALSPISVHTEMGPSETRPPLRSGKKSTGARPPSR